MTIFFKNKEYRKFSIASILSSAGGYFILFSADDLCQSA